MDFNNRLCESFHDILKVGSSNWDLILVSRLSQTFSSTSLLVFLLHSRRMDWVPLLLLCWILSVLPVCYCLFGAARLVELPKLYFFPAGLSFSSTAPFCLLFLRHRFLFQWNLFGDCIGCIEGRVFAFYQTSCNFRSGSSK